jgi:hypothetical protein
LASFFDDIELFGRSVAKSFRRRYEKRPQRTGRIVSQLLMSCQQKSARSDQVGTARCAVRAAFSGAIKKVRIPNGNFIPPAATRAGTSQRDVPTLKSGHCQNRRVRPGRFALRLAFERRMAMLSSPDEKNFRQH